MLLFVCDDFPLTRTCCFQFLLFNLLKEQPLGHSGSSAKNLRIKSQNVCFRIDVNSAIVIFLIEIFVFRRKSSHNI